MKQPIIAILSLGLVWIACSEPEKPKDIDPPATTEIPVTPVQNCYQGIFKRDTISLNLNIKGDNVAGDLSYRIFEKDRNTGTVEGTIKGDSIKGFYTFRSEGMESIREVVFLRYKGGLVEGFGEVKEQDGRTVFTDHRQLSFDTTRPLQPVNCKK